MKPEELKLFNKYKHINIPDKELIYIGIDKRDGDHIFLYKSDSINYEDLNGFKYHCEFWEFTNELYQTLIVKINNIEIYYHYYSNNYRLREIKPFLRRKLKNIMNR